MMNYHLVKSVGYNGFKPLYNLDPRLHSRFDPGVHMDAQTFTSTLSTEVKACSRHISEVPCPPNFSFRL